jgi:hypothetical protein
MLGRGYYVTSRSKGKPPNCQLWPCGATLFRIDKCKSREKLWASSPTPSLQSGHLVLCWTWTRGVTTTAVATQASSARDAPRHFPMTVPLCPCVRATAGPKVHKHVDNKFISSSTCISTRRPHIHRSPPERPPYDRYFSWVMTESHHTFSAIHGPWWISWPCRGSASRWAYPSPSPPCSHGGFWLGRGDGRGYQLMHLGSHS